MMKSSFLLAALVICTQAIGEEDLVQQWNKFQVDFGKSYRSPVEARKRFVIFSQNLQEIDTHNALYKSGKVSYVKGINRFADWTDDEFMQFTNGGLVGEPSPSGEIFHYTESSDLPESVDWRDKGVVTPVKDQGSCASCWAFSAAGAIEAQYALKTKNLISLSEQDLVDCSEKEGNYGCIGGWMHYAFEYVKNNGIESEEDYPYKGWYSTKCTADSSKIVTKIRCYNQIEPNNEKALQSGIASNGPVTAAIWASDNLMLYESGIFEDPECKGKVNHGVLAVGYGSENGQDYYIIKNSWGLQWGDSGYFKLARNHGNMCNVSSVAHYPQI